MRRFSLLLVISSILAACKPAVDFEAEQDAIRAAWDGSVAAALDGNYEDYVAFLSEEIEVVHPDASLRLTGLENLDPIYRPAIEGRAYTGINTKRFDVQVAPSGDFAWGTAEAEVSLGSSARTIWFGLVYRKEAGKWKLVLAHDAEAKTPPTPDQE